MKKTIFILLVLILSNAMVAQSNKKKTSKLMTKNPRLSTQKKSKEMTKQALFFAGVISKPEATAYMYGTHVLMGKPLNGNPDEPEKNYALKSDKCDLDKYTGQRVIIMASSIEGYPVDFGPEYLQVSHIEEDKPISIDGVK